MANIPVEVSVNMEVTASGTGSLVIDVNPDTLLVARNPEGDTTILVWSVPEGSSALIRGFQWNNPQGKFRPSVVVTSPSGETQIQSEPYSNNPVLIPPEDAHWFYTITISDGTHDKATIDPEVDNDPPS